MDNKLKVKKKIIVTNEQGLHARPAALFVQTANKFNSSVNVQKGKQVVDGKSIMGILMLAAECGAEILIIAEGEDAHAAILELERIVISNE